MYQYNGTRNYEIASDYVAKEISAKIPGLKVFVENYHDISISNYPCINVVTQRITPEYRDAQNTRNTVDIDIIVYGDSLTEGNGNSNKSKKTVMEINGKIDNLFSKLNGYSPNKLQGIGTVSTAEIRFGSKEVYNATGSVFSIQTIKLTITEDNTDKFTTICKELDSKVDLEGTENGYHYIGKIL